jgi:predicted enzyme related to lactoylglutathione lyase
MTARLEAVHPVLLALDVAGAVAFYKKIGFALTFQDNADDPRYVGVKRDAVVIHLQWHDASEIIVGADRPNYRFQVEDVDALYEEFLSSGALIGQGGSGPWRKPAQTPWGTREFHLRDPSGNGLQFYRNSPATAG